MPARRTMEDAKTLFYGPVGECWTLPAGVGGPSDQGYWVLMVSRKQWYAHRLSYTLLVGAIPDGLEIDHVCHTQDSACPGGNTCPHRKCVNPAHLEAVTGRVNSLRSRSRAAENARKVVCAKGHELIGVPGNRHCPTCKMAARIARGETSGRGSMATRTHCPAGHEYTEENTYRFPSHPTERICRKCQRIRKAKRRQRIAP